MVAHNFQPFLNNCYFIHALACTDKSGSSYDF
jgi:hypothetical protein